MPIVKMLLVPFSMAGDYDKALIYSDRDDNSIQSQNR